MLDKFNILIAGPIYDAKFVENNVKYYSDQGFHVTVSTWEGWESKKLTIPHVISSMNHINGEKIYGFHPLKSKEFESSLYYQAKCVENALDADIQPTDFIIKLRSDEFYSDLTQIVFELTANPNQIVTNNVFLKDQKEVPFSISDHVIGMTAENMEKTFRNLCFFFDTYRNLINPLIFPKGVMSKRGNKANYVRPEIIISKMFLQSIGIVTPLDDTQAEVIMRDYFTGVDITHMGEYFISCTHQNVFFSNIPNINKNLPKVGSEISKAIPFPSNNKFGLRIV